MGSPAETPPRGNYLAHEVGQLAGVSGDQIGQWARHGYIRPSQGDGHPYRYSYQDVAEAMVVHELRAGGASLTAVRLTITRLREREDLNWPLQHAALAAVGDGVIELAGEHAWDLSGPNAGQAVLAPRGLHPIIAQLERGGWAVRQLPDLRHIEVNPDRLGGRPTIRGRRVGAADVARLAAVPGGPAILEADYAITAEQSADALRWWLAIQEFEHRTL